MAIASRDIRCENGASYQGARKPMWKIGLAAAIGLAIAPAQAGHYRGYANEAIVCTPVGDYLPPYIFPAPNWRPFFAKHMYVSPAARCLPSDVPYVASEQVVRTKY